MVATQDRTLIKPRPTRRTTKRKPLWHLFAIIGAGLLLILAFLLTFDFVFLRGKTIDLYRGVAFGSIADTPSIHVGAAEQNSALVRIEFDIDRPQERHTIIISTYPQDLALAWSVTSKEGWEAVNDRDIVRASRNRLVEFVPQTPGTHLLTIERLATQAHHAQRGLIKPSKVDTVNVRILVNDRSIVQRLMAARTSKRGLFRSG